jgi:hypothetical protein
MLDQQILDEALSKKNKEFENLKTQYNEMKKTFENKIKNLMNSISQIKAEKDMVENNNKDNIRVNIINKLKEERKDQESIISLLRKLISDEDKVDKYLAREFNKRGANSLRLMSYEEQKIKIKQLESDIIGLKFKSLKEKIPQNSVEEFFEDGKTREKRQISSTTIINNNITFNKKSIKKKEIDFSKIETDELIEFKMADKFKTEITNYEEKISNLNKENYLLKIAKEKMENSQNELFDKLKNYNNELGELKSIYDVIKNNLEIECKQKVDDALLRIEKSQEENFKLKEKINEMIEICERQNKDNFNTIKRISNDNDLLKKTLESKKYEVNVLKEEIQNYQREMEKSKFGGDVNTLLKIKNIEKEREDLRKKNTVYEDKIKHLDSMINQKEYLLSNLHLNIEEKEKTLIEKEMEIDLINGKLQDLEIIMMKNYVKNQYN